MKKLLAFLIAPVILLTACGGPAEPTITPDDGSNASAFNLHLIGVSEYNGWFDNIAETTEGAETIYTFHKVDSVFDQTELVKEIINSKNNEYINGILIGFSPQDYIGGTQEAAEENFNTKKAYIEELSTITLPADFVLMISHGFPKLEEESDEFLLWNYEATRAFLEEKFVETEERIVNFGILRTLSNDTKYLVTDFINEEGELNELAFNKLNADLGMYLGLLSKRRNNKAESKE